MAAEVRNLIYAYALTFDKPVTIRSKGSKFYTCHFGKTDEEWKRVNNIAFVCRQLHYETKGLIYRFNAIEFNHKVGRSTAIQTCSRFLRSAPKDLKRSLRQITVIEKKSRDADTEFSWIGTVLTGLRNEDVYDFCRTHRRAHVIVRVDREFALKGFHGQFYLLELLALRMTLRDQQLVDVPEGLTRENQLLQMYKKIIEDCIWQIADRSMVLDNYRATHTASWIEGMDGDMWDLAKGIFEEGC